MSSAARTLSTAEERREAVLEAALPVFARRGFEATPTAEVARAAGISHAYLFRLYPTKSDLAAAVVRRSHERILAAFRAAAREARTAGADVFQAIGEAYVELLRDRELLLLQLHANAAAPDDPQVLAAARDGVAAVVDLVERETGADAARIGAFYATGMLLNVLAALDAEHVDAHWARVLEAFCIGTEK